MRAAIRQKPRYASEEARCADARCRRARRQRHTAAMRCRRRTPRLRKINGYGAERAGARRHCRARCAARLLFTSEYHFFTSHFITDAIHYHYDFRHIFSLLMRQQRKRDRPRSAITGMPQRGAARFRDARATPLPSDLPIDYWPLRCASAPAIRRYGSARARCVSRRWRARVPCAATLPPSRHD